MVNKFKSNYSEKRIGVERREHVFKKKNELKI